MLGFYIHVAHFQEDLHHRLMTTPQSREAAVDRELPPSEISELSFRFEAFLSMVEAWGPKTLAVLSCDLRTLGQDVSSEPAERRMGRPLPIGCPGILSPGFPATLRRTDTILLRPARD